MSSNFIDVEAYSEAHKHDLHIHSVRGLSDGTSRVYDYAIPQGVSVTVMGDSTNDTGWDNWCDALDKKGFHYVPLDISRYRNDKQGTRMMQKKIAETKLLLVVNSLDTIPVDMCDEVLYGLAHHGWVVFTVPFFCTPEGEVWNAYQRVVLEIDEEVREPTVMPPTSRDICDFLNSISPKVYFLPGLLGNHPGRIERDGSTFVWLSQVSDRVTTEVDDPNSELYKNGMKLLQVFDCDHIYYMVYGTHVLCDFKTGDDGEMREAVLLNLFGNLPLEVILKVEQPVRYREISTILVKEARSEHHTAAILSAFRRRK